MKSLLKFAVPAAAFLLAGCWGSPSPLMPDKALDKAPLANAVTAGTHSEVATRTKYSVEWNGKVATATPVEWNGDKGEQLILKFDLLQKGVYLLQATDGNGAMKGYLIAKFDAQQNMRVYNPNCDGPEAALPGVTVDGSTCNFADYATLLKAAKTEAVDVAAGLDEAAFYNQYSPTNATTT